MKLFFRYIFILMLLVATIGAYAQSQGKVYTYEEGEKYFTMEFDLDQFPTWGTYRATNIHQRIIYFEMTFLADKKASRMGDSVLVVVPTFYNYSFRHEILGEADIRNSKTQKIKFNFFFKDNDKRLEYIVPDSIARQQIFDYSSFELKKEIDITAFPKEMVQTKKPKWDKFPLGLRFNLSEQHEKKRRGGFQ